MVLDPHVLSFRRTRRDAVIAALLALVVLIAALGSLYPSCGWGDDFACRNDQRRADRAEKNHITDMKSRMQSVK